jgi:integrase
MYLDNTEKNKKDVRAQLEIVTSAIGRARDVRTLSEHDVRQYEARRRSGGIAYREGKVTRAVRQRTVQADVKLLKQVLYWGASVTLPSGERLLDRNPIEYVRVKGEHDVVRPIASQERFEATRRAMQDAEQRYEIESVTLDSARKRGQALRRRDSWVRGELGLVLLEATGKRRSSIVGLRWDDIDFERNRITWRPEHDKRRKTRVVPYPASLIETLRGFRQRLGAVNGYLFPREDDTDEHIPRELFSQWIEKAERAAGLPKLRGGVTHPYRRKWRSERRHLPIKAVAEAGGWDDIGTMERSYDLPDEEDILAVTSETKKRYENASANSRATN